MPIVDEHQEEEVWKSPPSLNKWWVEVSNLGRVRTTPHKSKFIWLGRTIERLELGKVRKIAKDTRGRLILHMAGRKSQRTMLVHRLVAECFVANPNPRRYNYVFFKNGNVSDCRAENLQWGDGRDKGWLLKGKRARNLIQIYDNGKFVGEYFGLGEAAEVLGVTSQAVHSAIKRGGLCKGFFLQYENRNNRAYPPKNIEEGRYSRSREFEFVKIPDSIFTEQDIDIRPKAVFQ